MVAIADGVCQQHVPEMDCCWPGDPRDHLNRSARIESGKPHGGFIRRCQNPLSSIQFLKSNLFRFFSGHRFFPRFSGLRCCFHTHTITTTAAGVNRKVVPFSEEFQNKRNPGRGNDLRRPVFRLTSQFTSNTVGRMKSTSAKRFSRNVRAILAARGLTVTEAAKRAGLARPGYSKILAGKEGVTLDRAERIARSLRVPLPRLLEKFEDFQI